jgi:hypothetical protein
MKATDRRRRGRKAMGLVEEAVHLVRLAPGAVLAGYYFGSLPFVLGLLYFWADMSRSPYAGGHLAGSAFGLALLFLWMKFWQAVFANNLRAQISAAAPPRWTVRRCVRLFIIQAALQPSAAIALPVAAAIAFPFGWIYAFYQNVTALADGEIQEVMPVLKNSWRQCALWPLQNHGILLIMSLFGLCVFLNLVMVCLSLPELLKTLLGVESVYSQSPFSMLNTTFFAAMFGLTYLCVDPIMKAVYVLRCFYGESLQSGEDLKAELKQFLPSAKPALAALVLLLSLVATPAQDTSTAPAAPPPAGAEPHISPPQLDRAIDETIHQPKYTWRLPREKMAKDTSTTNGPVARFFERAMTAIRDFVKGIFEWIGKVLDKMFRRSASSSGGGGKNGTSWIGSLQGLLFVLLIILVSALVIFICRVWYRSYRPPAPVVGEAIAVVPDIADENVGADQLPEDGWIKLGRELLERGEFRLAMRAFYFASLTHLAARGLISIAKFKSNRDYERELRRRSHSLPEVLSLFGDNVAVFDRSWYGLHEVNPGLVDEFRARVERIKAV